MRDYINSRAEDDDQEDDEQVLEEAENLAEVGAQWDKEAIKKFFKKASNDGSKKL